MRLRSLALMAAALCLMFAATFASAGSVNFDDVTAPADFIQVPSYSPTVYPGVQFNNGVILNDSDYANDATTKPNLYATSDYLPLGDGTLLPGNIDAVFSSVVSDVNFDLMNGAASSTFNLFGFDSGGQIVFFNVVNLCGFGDVCSIAHINMNVPGISQVVIDSNQGTGSIDFATDTWSWNGTATPEPSSLLLLGSGALGLAGMIRRKLM